jgi:hypothetical protein
MASYFMKGEPQTVGLYFPTFLLTTSIVKLTSLSRQSRLNSNEEGTKMSETTSPSHLTLSKKILALEVQ